MMTIRLNLLLARLLLFPTDINGDEIELFLSITKKSSCQHLSDDNET